MMLRTANNGPAECLSGRLGGAVEVVRGVETGAEGAGDPPMTATKRAFICPTLEAVIAWHVLEQPLPAQDRLPPWRLYSLCRLVLSMSPRDPEAEGPAAVSPLARALAGSEKHSAVANALNKALQEWRRARGFVE